MSELKPCPFCGEKVAILVGGDKIGEYFRVKCWGCGAQTVAKRTRAEAIEAWNHRTERTTKIEHVDMKNVNNHIYKCLECGQYFHRTGWSRPVKYCCQCGAKLDWSDYE